ncbi:hypothetical protein EDB89DRAFT_2155411 [Lactarius sanguifluus]|nr:hypothetical protein EDB89DRAFT_2155411 [Lactarius sanguifluus]
MTAPAGSSLVEMPVAVVGVAMRTECWRCEGASKLGWSRWRGMWRRGANRQGKGGGRKGAGNGSVSGSEWVGKGKGGGGSGIGGKTDSSREWAGRGTVDEGGGHGSGGEGEWVNGGTRGKGKGEGENAGDESDGSDDWAGGGMRGGRNGTGNGSSGRWVDGGMGNRGNGGEGEGAGKVVGDESGGGSEWAGGGADGESGGHESGGEGEWVDGGTRGEGKNAGGESDGSDGGKGVPLTRVIKLLGQRGGSDGAAESRWMFGMGVGDDWAGRGGGRVGGWWGDRHEDRLWLLALRVVPGSGLNIRGGSVSYYSEAEVHVQWLEPSRQLLEALNRLLCKGCARTRENVFEVEEGVMV